MSFNWNWYDHEKSNTSVIFSLFVRIWKQKYRKLLMFHSISINSYVWERKTNKFFVISRAKTKHTKNTEKKTSDFSFLSKIELVDALLTYKNTDQKMKENLILNMWFVSFLPFPLSWKGVSGCKETYSARKWKNYFLCLLTQLQLRKKFSAHNKQLSFFHCIIV